jgi:hypothetical protein
MYEKGRPYRRVFLADRTPVNWLFLGQLLRALHSAFVNADLLGNRPIRRRRNEAVRLADPDAQR